MKLMLLVPALVMANLSWAGPVGPGGSVTYEQIRAGTNLFPAAICPGINKKYEDITEKLIATRAAIRKTGNCPEEQIKVDGFAKLVEQGRGTFWELFKKGEAGGLTPEEAGKMQSYVEAVTKAGGTVVDIAMGTGCFKDEKNKSLSVELVASIVTESTQALSSLVPVYGPLVSMGGKIAGGLIVSIDKVVRARRTYDFRDSEQRKGFLKSMCAYDAFRAEIDEITRIDQALADRRRYQRAVQAQLKLLIENCPDCNDMYQEYKAAALKGESWTWDPTSKLIERFKDRVTNLDRTYDVPLGTATATSMRSQIWVQAEIDRLDENVSDLGDIERERVVELQDTIEDFYFVKWLPVFVNYYRGEIQRRHFELYQSLANHNLRLGYLEPLFVSSIDKLALQIYQTTVLQPGTFRSIADKQTYIRGAQADVDAKLADLVSAIHVFEKTCRFVRAANLKYEAAMQNVCEVAPRDMMERLYHGLLKMGFTTHTESAVLKSLWEVPGPVVSDIAQKWNLPLPNEPFTWSANWLQSVTLMIEKALPMIDGPPRLKAK